MDDRDLKLEHFMTAILISCVLWGGALLALRLFVEAKSCIAERQEASAP